MPTVRRVGGCRLFFYSNEGREPPHVHVELGTATAKFWIAPVRLARSRGFRFHQLLALQSMVAGLEAEIEQAWHRHFGG